MIPFSLFWPGAPMFFLINEIFYFTVATGNVFICICISPDFMYSNVLEEYYREIYQRINLSENRRNELSSAFEFVS